MRCLVTGADGQLGRALQATAPTGAQVIAPPEAECDITKPPQIEHWLRDTRPDVLFNAAAYTAVDRAEREPDAALLANATSVGQLADIAKRHGTYLVHVSTDFVFDGEQSRPYAPGDAPNPLNVYGRTKLQGELALARSGVVALIVRTAWLYAERGNNFVNTMLRLLREREEVRVVVDQIGTPTYARNLAAALWGMAQRETRGTFHFTDTGVASWYDFAVAIREEALGMGFLENCGPVVPIASVDYPTPARRPRFSVLDKTETWRLLGHTGQNWREALRDMLRRAKQNG